MIFALQHKYLLMGGATGARMQGRKRFFFEKKKQKTFISPVFEWPQYGRSGAGG
jgi:hypothetical protein